MPCGWEGNRRSGVALAMRHRLQWFIHQRAHGLDREMSTPPTLSCGVWPIYLFTCRDRNSTSVLIGHCRITYSYTYFPVDFHSL